MFTLAKQSIDPLIHLEHSSLRTHFPDSLSNRCSTSRIRAQPPKVPNHRVVHKIAARGLNYKRLVRYIYVCNIDTTRITYLNLTDELAVGPAAVDGGHEAERSHQQADREVVARQARQQVPRLEHREKGAIDSLSRAL